MSLDFFSDGSDVSWEGESEVEEYYDEYEGGDEYEMEEYAQPAPQYAPRQNPPPYQRGQRAPRPTRTPGNGRGVRRPAALPPNIAGQPRGTMNQQVRHMSGIYKTPSYQQAAGTYGQGQVQYKTTRGPTNPQFRSAHPQHQRPQRTRSRATRGGIRPAR